ncbi:hypothetical protein C0J50_21811 [Silurus asotus]|uniref:protein-serine/threonine phosphatase n=1 Tax=Silurus asotus TaxID=30991 RepID=A0AAD5FKA1_SILAS|nr:hypothetical protein C0J50_21811 [Silurus asotus]
MNSAERKTSVDHTVQQNVSGLTPPDGDYAENGQFSGEITKQDKLDCSEISSLSEFDLEHSESFSINGDFSHLIENSKRSECSAESNVSDQTETEEREPETLFQTTPELCMHYEDVDTEIQALVLSDLEMLNEQETKSEQHSEEDFSGEGSEEISVSDSYEQHSEQDDQNAVFELDYEPCPSFEQCELNNQNMPCECHTTHFESSEMCQASQESMPAGLPGSLEQQPPAGQIETTYDSELTLRNIEGSGLDSFESSVQSQLSDSFAEQTSDLYQSFEYYNAQEYNQMSLNDTECIEALEQCASCGKYFEKCDIPEQCESSEPAQNSEDPQHSESFENPLELCEAFGTQCSVFHTSELPRENLPIELNTNKVRKRTERDMMFIGSMETFEARWISQFLAVDHHPNNTLEKQDLEGHSVAINEPNNELLSCGSNAEPEPVIAHLDTTGENRVLCEECEMKGIGELKYAMSSELFEFCDMEAETFEFEYDESKTGESVVKGASIDECSEEEYSDCIDGKSQGSAETEESFKSLIEESEEIYPLQTDDSELLDDFHEKDEGIAIHRQESYDISEGLRDTLDSDTPDEVEEYENAQEFCSEPKTSQKELCKTYAEVLCFGLHLETVQSIEPFLEEAVLLDEEDYGSEHDDEDTTDTQSHSYENENVESSEETIAPEPSESEIYGLPNADERIYKQDASDPSSIQSESHEQGISTLETIAEHDSITESELSEKFTEFSRLVETEVQHRLVSETGVNESKAENEALTDDDQIDEENDLEVIDETDEHQNPCCGEIETCEDVDTFSFCTEEVEADVEICTETNAGEDPQNDALDLPIAQNALELNSDEDPCVDPEPPGCRNIALELAETTERKDDPPPESECIGKLDKIIHQAVQSTTTENSEPDHFFKLAGEIAAYEQIEEDTEESDDEDYPESCDCEFCVQSIEQVPAKPLLPQSKSKDAGKICVVIDLDETLVHSSFKPVNNADFIIPVEIDGAVHQVYVLKRPHVDEFLKRMGELFECVLFTASLAKYADPVSDLLDKWGAFRCRLFRESCVFHRGNYVKDLSRLGRDLNKVIIVDNSPASYIFHPDNAVPVASWFDDMADTELLDLIPFFERLSKVDDVYAVLKQQRTSS